MRKIRYSRSSLKLMFHMVILLFTLAFLQGCAEYRLKMMDSDPEKNSYDGQTISALAWGQFYDPQQITAGCNTETGINDVMVKNNYLYNLASVFSFGIYMPLEIHYRCQSAPGDVTDFK